MKQTLKVTQKLNQTLQLSLSMKQSLEVLKMSQSDLLSSIQEIVASNPILEYTPSVDMHQYLNEAISTHVSLQEELYLQLHTTKKKYDETIANFIIESLDDNGFLSYDSSTYCQLLKTSKKAFVETLHVLQTFEPSGVCAQNSIDSIRIQLKEQYLYDAQTIWEDYQQQLIKQDYQSIQEALHLSLEEVKECIHDIQQCDPFPCRNYTSKKEKFILPDFEITIVDGQLQIELAQIGHIHIDDELKHKQISPTLKAYFSEAYYFVDSLNKRNKTLLMMADALLHIQKNYFLFNDELQPCTLSDIAQTTSFHESTVSRTLSNKYYLFNNEIYPVKALFVSATKEGSSKDAIKKAMLQVIHKEDKSTPLSDQEIVEQLATLDLYVSRRAVAKYREQLLIANSKQRKRKKET